MKIYHLIVPDSDPGSLDIEISSLVKFLLIILTKG